MKNENPLSKPGTLSGKIQELIQMYYVWRKEHSTDNYKQIHVKCESLNNLYFRYLHKNKIDMDKHGEHLRSYMDFLTNCYTLIKKDEDKKARKRAAFNNA